MTDEIPTAVIQNAAAAIQSFLKLNYPCACTSQDPCDGEASEAYSLAELVAPAIWAAAQSPLAAPAAKPAH